MTEREEQQAAAIAGEFPGWLAWVGLNNVWHARLAGATPPRMVHGDTAQDVSEQIREQARRGDWRPAGGSL